MGLNNESLLTLDERQGRLGVDPSIAFDNTERFNMNMYLLMMVKEVMVLMW